MTKVLFGRLADRAQVVAPAIRQRFSAEWIAIEIDLVFVHYLYGLAVVALPGSEPDAMIEILRDLAGNLLGSESFECALRTAPPAMGALLPRAAEIARAANAAEALGRRDSQSILSAFGADPNQIIKPNGNVKIVQAASLVRLPVIEEALHA